MSTKNLREQEQAQRKNERSRQILESSYQLFLEQGLVAVEMKDIAKLVQIGRATLYRYFPSKQELAFAVLEYISSEYIIPKYKSERQIFIGNGYQKFAQFVKQLVHAYQQFPDFFRFSAMIEAHYGNQIASEEQAAWYRELFAGLFVVDTPKKFLEEGQSDGSIRSDIDPHLYLATVLATIPTLSEHIAINPDFAAQLYDVVEPTQLLETASDALIRALLPR